MVGPLVERGVGHDYPCPAEAAIDKCAANCLPNAVARESEWTDSNGHRSVVWIGRNSRPTERASFCLLPGVCVTALDKIARMPANPA
jgi:hypothetical protein